MASIRNRLFLCGVAAGLTGAMLTNDAFAQRRNSPNFNFNINRTGPTFPAIPPVTASGFFFANPLSVEAARQSSILFNRSLSFNQNQPVPPQVIPPRMGYVPGTNPFLPLPNGMTLQQAAYNMATLNNAAAGNPLLAAAAAYAPALSAYPYGAATPYINPYASGGEPYGGYLSGGAGAYTAGSNTLVASPLAAYEAGRQARLDTRRRAFDEYLYERLNAPTAEDLRQFTQREGLRRSLSDPPHTEVWSGESLNALLADVQKLQGVNGDKAGDIPLDEDMVKRLNVTNNASRGNMGLLKDGGRLSWPLGLRILGPTEEARDLRSQIDTLLQDGMSQAANGKVDPGLLQELTRDVARMQQLLLVRVGDMPMDMYMESKRFLSDLDSAVKLLRQPDAGEYASGRYAAKGSTVQRLVQYMTDHGLQFAPAVPGDEGAYMAVQRALAKYDSALRTNHLHDGVAPATGLERSPTAPVTRTERTDTRTVVPPRNQNPPRREDNRR